MATINPRRDYTKHRRVLLVITWRETAKKKLMKFGGNKYKWQRLEID